MTAPIGAVLAASRAAPPVALAALTGGAPILVLTPHPDDESLGCGGLLAACRSASIPVTIALLTDATGSHPNSASHPPAALGAIRKVELAAALAELGIDAATSLHELDWPDAGAPSEGPAFGQAVTQLATLIRQTGSRTIFTAWRHDPHCDHLAGARIAAAAARLCGIRSLAFPVWSYCAPPDTPITATPAWRLDIAPYLPAKRRAVARHRSQLGQIVQDDPTGFSIPAALLAACLTDREIFFDQSEIP